MQLNDNVTFLLGNHTVKAGVEYNVTAASQTFLGFANGRYIFSSTAGFLSYLANPHYVECSNGTLSTTSQTGACPAGYSINGPVLLYLQQAGVGNVSVNDAGTQTITQKEPAVFIQDSWQPMPNLTVQAGLRWEAQIEPDPITPPAGLLRGLHRQDTGRHGLPLRRHDPVGQEDVAAALRDLLRPGQRRQDGPARHLRPLLRAHPRPGSRLLPFDQRQPRTDDLPRRAFSAISAGRCRRRTRT